jgi:hypothetical protein
MNMNCPAMVDGDTMTAITPISGYLTAWVLTGDPITMDVGFGIPTMGMSGTLLTHGDILPTTMADGTGTLFIIGIGYLAITGLQPGCPGTGMIITMAGAPSVGGIDL